MLTLPLAAIVVAIVYATTKGSLSWKLTLGAYVILMNFWALLAIALDKCYARSEYRRIKEVSLLSIHFATGMY